jgi:DNA-binding transcriptional ArsR family regulator
MCEGPRQPRGRSAKAIVLDKWSVFADYSGMADQTAPDYQLPDSLALNTDQLRTLCEPTRMAIIELLGERAATTSELAHALGKPKGTIGHHCKSLESAGLIAVVRTRQARAMVAKYYGRTARTFVLDHVEEIGFSSGTMLNEAVAEIERFHRANPTAESPGITSLRYARIPRDQAEDWARRLDELLTEFTREPRAGDLVFGLAVSLFPTTKPVLPEETP